MADEMPKFIDDLSVREVYAEVVQTLYGAPGTIRVELGVNRWTQQPPLRPDRVVPVARFVLGFDTAKALRDQLANSIAIAEKQAAGQLQPPPESPKKN